MRADICTRHSTKSGACLDLTANNGTRAMQVIVLSIHAVYGKQPHQ